MKTLLVQDYLRSGKTLNDLIIEHGVYSNITNGKIGLSYDQIESRPSDPLACECRGLILEENTYNIVAFPFKRFFNLAEESLIPKDFDWNSAKIYNKIDGTLCIIYNYKDCWYMGTRSKPEADVGIDGGMLTFSMLFDHTVTEMYINQYYKTYNINPSGKKNIQDLMSCFGEDAKKYTFMFELTSPLNRIVCNYYGLNLTLLGVRDNESFQEQNPEIWLNDKTELYGLKTSEVFSFKDINETINTVNSWKPEEKEGVVVVDKNFNRIKIKSIAYSLFNKMRDSLSTSVRGCIEAILLGKDDDLIGMMPPIISDRLIRLKPAIQKVFTQTEIDFNEIKDVENMKEFAGYAEFKLWPAAMYALKRKKIENIHQFALGRQQNGKISSGSLDTILSLCEKVDPSLKDLKPQINN